MASSRRLALFALSIYFCAIPGTLRAQQTSIGGSITDSSGAAIPQAIVKASSKNGGASVTLTNSQGAYQLSSLSAADYVVRVEAPGFAPAERSLTLLIGQTLALDLQLHPAAVNSAVDVVADVPQVETTSSAVASNIDPHQMHDIPLNGRNWMQLALLAPGITKNDVDSNSPIGGADGGKFQINVDGQQVTQNNSSSGFGQPRFSQDADVFSATPSGAWLPAVMAGDTGIAFGTRLQSLVTVAGHPNELKGGKRPRVTLSPTLILKDGKPVYALSTPGADNQDQALLQVILNLIEFDMTAQEAVEAPRFQTQHFYSSFAMHEFIPGKLNLESRISRTTADQLASLGHIVSVTGPWSNLSAPVVIKIGDGVLEGGADPRRSRFIFGR